MLKALLAYTTAGIYPIYITYHDYIFISHQHCNVKKFLGHNSYFIFFLLQNLFEGVTGVVTQPVRGMF